MKLLLYWVSNKQIKEKKRKHSSAKYFLFLFKKKIKFREGGLLGHEQLPMEITPIPYSFILL